MVAFVAFLAFLSYGRPILVPIALALLFTLLLGAVASQLQKIAIGSWRMPRWLCMTLSLLLLAWFIAFTSAMVTATATEMIARAPTYQANVDRLLITLKQSLNLSAVPTISDLLDKIDLRQVARETANTVSGMAAVIGVISVYVLFLLLERSSLKVKVAALSKDSNDPRRLWRMLEEMAQRIRAYIFLKTLHAVLCAVIAYIVMLLVGLDFAVFWAFLTFVTYFVPTIGSLIAIALPTLLALIQFETPSEAIIIFVVSGGLQTAVANLLEPRLMGQSMNLSPFVVVVSLFAWGALWGVAGMFLCVPLTVIAMIVFSYFPGTYPIAVLLSSDGEVARQPVSGD